VAYGEGRGCSRRDLDNEVGDIPWYPRDLEGGEGNWVHSVMMSIPFLQLEGDFFPLTHSYSRLMSSRMQNLRSYVAEV
jgi:hypothetical protein